MEFEVELVDDYALTGFDLQTMSQRGDGGVTRNIDIDERIGAVLTMVSIQA